MHAVGKKRHKIHADIDAAEAHDLKINAVIISNITIFAMRAYLDVLERKLIALRRVPIIKLRCCELYAATVRITGLRTGDIKQQAKHGTWITHIIHFFGSWTPTYISYKRM